jgi:hypothetical protein
LLLQSVIEQGREKLHRITRYDSEMRRGEGRCGEERNRASTDTRRLFAADVATPGRCTGNYIGEWPDGDAAPQLRSAPRRRPRSILPALSLTLGVATWQHHGRQGCTRGELRSRASRVPVAGCRLAGRGIVDESWWLGDTSKRSESNVDACDVLEQWSIGRSNALSLRDSVRGPTGLAVWSRQESRRWTLVADRAPFGAADIGHGLHFEPYPAVPLL